MRLVEDPVDHRSPRVSLTDKVGQLAKEKETGIEAFVQGLYQGISDQDLLTTIRTLQTMERNLNQ